ncbi:hypothetical protein NPIL_650291 [Nephila pilipes]|uniref:Uncharacterized protein n=1 Tax=Nephila pilipes TaxID=299642 RepID=A0A8X6QVR7_NEPPI|nr:hypothetical protein NPIL_650291 [Nephila pilipes]
MDKEGAEKNEKIKPSRQYLPSIHFCMLNSLRKTHSAIMHGAIPLAKRHYPWIREDSLLLIRTPDKHEIVFSACPPSLPSRQSSAMI